MSFCRKITNNPMRSSTLVGLATFFLNAFGWVFTGSSATSLLVNGNFELGTNPGINTQINSGNSTALTGWTVRSGNIDYIGTRWVAGDGVRCIELNGTTEGIISQTVTGLRVGQSYRLTFQMAVNPEAPPPTTDLSVRIGSFNSQFSMTNGGTINDLGWEPKALEFVAAGTSAELS